MNNQSMSPCSLIDQSSKTNNPIQIVLQSPTNFRNIINKKPSQVSLINTENILINNNILNMEGDGESKCAQQNSSSSLQIANQSSQNNNNSNNNNNNNNNSTSNNKHLKNDDDIEIMKQRSANNNTFLCIKIPEIQLLVSYRATNKDKNIKDLKNVSLIFPLFEVHDKTWTWLDLINALKSHVKKALVRNNL